MTVILTHFCLWAHTHLRETHQHTHTYDELGVCVGFSECFELMNAGISAIHPKKTSSISQTKSLQCFCSLQSRAEIRWSLATFDDFVRRWMRRCSSQLYLQLIIASATDFLNVVQPNDCPTVRLRNRPAQPISASVAGPNCFRIARSVCPFVGWLVFLFVRNKIFPPRTFLVFYLFFFLFLVLKLVRY